VFSLSRRFLLLRKIVASAVSFIEEARRIPTIRARQFEKDQPLSPDFVESAAHLALLSPRRAEALGSICSPGRNRGAGRAFHGYGLRVS